MKEQFAAVFDRWYETILLYALSKTGDWDTAQEIAQETFIKLWTKGGEEIIYSHEPQRWLHIVAQNLVTDRHRLNAAARQMEKDIYYLTPDEDSKPELPPSSDLFERLASLPGKCRAVIDLTLIGKKTGEIMAYLGISQQNVLNQKTRGIKLLKEKLLKTQ